MIIIIIFFFFFSLCFSVGLASVSVSLTTGADEIGPLGRGHNSLSRLAADLCLDSHRRITPTEVEEQRPRPSQKITALGRCVNSAVTKRREEGVLCVHQVCIWFNMSPKQPDSCSGLGKFEDHSERPHTHTHTSCQLCESGFGPCWTDFPLQTSFKAIC